MTVDEIKDIIFAVNYKISPEIKKGRKISVSQFIESLKEPFDAAEVARKCCANSKIDPIKYPKYVGMTEEQILESWNAKASASRNYGRLLDSYIGYVLDGDDKPDVDSSDERAVNIISGFDDFYSKFGKINGLEFVARELPVYIKADEGFYISGRFDALFRNTTDGSFIIIDWKNTEDIKTSNRFQKMLGPLSRFDDCELNQYSIQLNLYVKALKDTYGIVSNPVKVWRYIVNIRGQKPFDNGSYFNILKPSIQYDDKLLERCFSTAKLIFAENV